MRSAFPGARRGPESAVLSLAAILLATAAAAQIDPPSAATIARQRAVQASLPFADRRDFALADRGFVATRRDPLIKTPDGRVAWDLNAYAFAKGTAPDSVNPSLWRQSTLLAKHGLFKVTDRVWQVRGFDLANITFVKGDTGWIVIDTLTCEETARAAYDLVTEQLGKRPIAAIVLTHSHGDHFGGTSALLRDAVPGVPILAPRGFLEAAISENVIAGPAMIRRASYHLGGPLPRGATGSVSSGIGPGIAVGTQTLVPPTREIDRTGEELTIDGVRMIFQLTPGTEAPAEMNVGLPDLKVIDLAENANATQHNILTTRGAQIRNAKRWAEGLTEAIDLFPDAEVVIASHAWPRWGRAEVGEYLAKHRDLYAYLHDQTVRLMNKGMTGDEIAATLALPPGLAKEWYDRPYYGSLSFNTRAVYQYYMGFFDGNPAPRPAAARGRRAALCRGARRGRQGARTGAGGLRRGRLRLGGRTAQPRRFRRCRGYRGQSFARALLRSARLADRDLDVAQFLPDRRHRAARGRQAPAGRGGRGTGHDAADARCLRSARDPARSSEGGRCAGIARVRLPRPQRARRRGDRQRRAGAPRNLAGQARRDADGPARYVPRQLAHRRPAGEPRGIGRGDDHRRRERARTLRRLVRPARSELRDRDAMISASPIEGAEHARDKT